MPAFIAPAPERLQRRGMEYRFDDLNHGLVYLPLNSWIEDYFVPLGNRLFQSDQEYRNGFDKLEFLWSLAYAHSIRASERRFWVPFGNFIYRSDRYSQLMIKVRDSLSTAGEHSPYVTSSIFGSSVQQCVEILDKIEPIAIEWSRQRW